MLDTIFKKDSVKKFFNDLVNGTVYKKKDIPYTISDEKMDVTYYAILMGLDAIIKYEIIIEKEDFFDSYLQEVQLLLRKVDNHNELKTGINKLIVNYCQKLLNLKNITTYENKEIILKHVYNKYIVNGYFYHSFPSIFLDEVNSNGLAVSNYNYEINSVKEVNKIFEKYNIKNVFSKDLNAESPLLTLTDSPFMASYYAYHCPYFLNELAVDLLPKDNNYEIDAFFLKDYKKCRKNLSFYLRKSDILLNDNLKILDFFDKEWNLFKVENLKPVVCFIKRSVVGNNNLNDFYKIMDNIDKDDLIVSVNKILETRFNNEVVKKDISRLSFEIVSLPTLKELGFNLQKEEIVENSFIEDEQIEVLTEDKSDNSNNNLVNYDFINNYGNITIVALIGVLLITIGVTVMIIMLGR
ncbi:MAG: hypothetical protein Q4E39_05635 [bacterium]|nr:hypothetical protein [bacterium]